MAFYLSNANFLLLLLHILANELCLDFVFSQDTNLTVPIFFRPSNGFHLLNNQTLQTTGTNKTDSSSSPHNMKRNLTYCNGISYNIGNWTARNMSANRIQNFECCTGQSGDGPLAHHVTDKCDVNATLENPTLSDHACQCARKYYADNPNANVDSFAPASANYIWEPDNCELVSFDAYQFCDMLTTRDSHVFFIGDSTVQQAKQTIDTMIAQTHWGDIALKNCLKRLHFTMSDSFLTGKKGFTGRGHTILHEVLDRLYLQHIHYDYIVFGSFHNHARPGDDSLSLKDDSFGNYLIPKLKEQLANIRRIYESQGFPPPKFIYKTTSVPHANCESSFGKGPDASLFNKSKFLSLNQEGLGHKYNWNEALNFDDRLIKFAREFDISVFRMYPLYSRPDGHPPDGDCLHYCGKLTG